ncbi:MAG TPA: hypothetical protein VHD32_17700 [Candidatus Didemnitutus sp.]|nr:hypothetical protein [Candidatus Didemnitutus sp.]
MASNKVTSAFTGPWHIDCRLSKELPDDKPIRGRFVAALVAGTLAAASVTWLVWAVYSRETRLSDIAAARHRIEVNNAEANRIRGVGTALAADAARIDDMYVQARAPLTVSEFIQETGRTRPAPIRLDMVELTTGSVTLRGGLNESSQRASVLLSRYVADLRGSAYFRKLFSAITLTSLERNEQTGSINFEITLKLKADAS